MQATIKLEYVKEALKDARNAWHTWAIADAVGGFASHWNGQRHPIPEAKQEEQPVTLSVDALQALAASELFQTVAKRMNAECMDYWPDDGA